MRTIWQEFSGPPLPWILFVPLVLFTACAGQTFPPDTAPEYLVTKAQTPLYHLGPQQAAPPEQRLAVDDRVRLLRRELGYSLARLASGETGYVANEDLTPAPPRPAATPAPPIRLDKPSESFPSVEEPLPKPDMQARPADAPPL